jgi:hypothetical protein
MLKEYLSTIANRFRIILGTTEPINAQDFEGAIADVFSKGHSTGLIIGRQEGYNSGYDQGFEDGKAEGGNTEEAYNQGVADGKQAEYDAFWNSYQQNGNRTAYDYGFSGICWNSEIFKPKHLPMQVVNGSYMFVMFDAQLKKASVAIDETIIDFTNATNVTSMFQNANISVIKMNGN